jgi:hypothetical protein
MSFKLKWPLAVAMVLAILLLFGLMSALAGANQLGDFVWYDQDGDGDKDGIAEWGAEGIDGVVVNLYKDDGNAIFEPGTHDVLSGTMTTGDKPGTTPIEHGWYDFVGLGDNLGWWVVIPDSNFNHGQPLEGYVYTGDSGPPPYSGENPRFIHFWVGPTDYNDADFGFTLKSTVAIGNRVWDDSSGSDAHKNNSTMDSDESGIDGVTVQLYQDTANADQCDPTADTLISTTTTSGGGIYQFANISAGDYCVVVPDSSIKGLGYVESSTGGAQDPDGADEANTNGDDGIPVGDYIISQVFHVAPGAQTNTADANDAVGYADASSYMTVDFGFLKESNNAVDIQSLNVTDDSHSWSLAVLLLLALGGGLGAWRALAPSRNV